MTRFGEPESLASGASSLPRRRSSSPARSRFLVFSRRRAERGAVLSLVTVLLLSTWGPALLNIGGYYTPELLGPPLVLYLLVRWPRLARALWRSIMSPAGMLGAVWITFVALLGAMFTQSAVGPYSEWRASLGLLFGFLFMYTRTGADAETWARRLMWVSLGALCLDIVLVGLGVLIPGFLGRPLAEDVQGRLQIETINVVAVAYLSTATGRIGPLSVAVALGMLMSLGGHRVVLLASAASALFLPLAVVEVLRSGRPAARWLRVGLAPALVVAIIAAARSSAVQDYLSEAKSIQYRLTVRSSDTIAGITRGLTTYEHVHFGDEAIRAAYATYLLTEWPSLLLPHGLGSREVLGRVGSEFDLIMLRFGVAPSMGSTHDNAVLYMVYHHGWLATWAVGSGLLWLFVRRLLRERGLIRRIQVCTAVLGVMVIDLAYPPVPGINIACIYGMFLGILFGRAGAPAARPLPRTGRP
jgi:hypothetical protein